MTESALKIAVVTGASRGIGQAIALELGKSATVLGTATSEAGAEKISAYLQENGITGKGYSLDVSSEASIEAFVKTVQQEFGAVDILVNNAGITRDNILMRMKSDEWDQVINTNLSSIYRMSK
ncbi:MAG: SDR family NAD(P)-dependent oxidoreductase, partial [Gammaproteobacteria bacterium]